MTRAPRPQATTPLQKLHAKAKRERWQYMLGYQITMLPKDVYRPFFSEYRWHPERDYRADWACSEANLLVEVDGGLFVNGGHTRGAARERDYERDAEAMLLGFRVLRVSPRHVKNGKAIQWIQSLLK